MSHVYLREIDLSVNDSLARIAALIQPGCRVLDVGTGSGALGRCLRERGCIVDGLTYSADEAEMAAASYSQLEVMNLELALPASKFCSGLYDVIVCADVLEHVRNASQVLADLRQLLAPQGRLLVSIPNATYMGVIFGLLGNHFERTSEGLLDATHVNFYDRRGLANLIAGAGFKLLECHDVVKGIEHSEFAKLDVTAFPKVLISYLLSRVDAATYQFVWSLARRDDELAPGVDAVIPSAPQLDIRPRFAAQLFCDFGKGFVEADSYYAWGLLEEAPQVLLFDRLQVAGTRSLRVDFSDRPGVFEFFGLRLLDSVGQCLWDWSGDWASNIQVNQCEWLPVSGLNGGRLVRATGPDPWVSFPVENIQWEKVNTAELRLTAPQPYLDAAFLWSSRRFEELVRTLSSELALSRQESQELLLKLMNEKDQHNTTKSRNAELTTELKTVYASISWRVTGWLRALKRICSKTEIA